MTDTIAAIATARGRGGIAIVRVSGPDAFLVAEKITGKRPQSGRFFFADFDGADEGLVLAFKGPHSYTGEDVVEFQGHGGEVAPRRVLERCFAAGARLARRGEFTERAFLNGRLALDQAEAVLDLIDAKTDRGAELALSGLHGERMKRCRSLYEKALSLSTQLEHALDVDEGDLTDEFFESANRDLANLRDGLNEAIKIAHEGKMQRNGALVVLTGKPNCGKSSLMNVLLGESRAIVSSTPGTTRDSIEEWVEIGGWPVRLVDTAGLRTTQDEIEREGVERAKSIVAKADVVLSLVDGVERKPQPIQPSQRRSRGDRPTIVIGTKSDLAKEPYAGVDVMVSSKTGEGIAKLRELLAVRLQTLAENAKTGGENAFDVISEDALRIAQNAIGSLVINANSDLVLVANELRMVAERLGKEVGAVYSSDLINGLFSRFCIGK